MPPPRPKPHKHNRISITKKQRARAHGPATTPQAEPEHLETRVWGCRVRSEFKIRTELRTPQAASLSEDDSRQRSKSISNSLSVAISHLALGLGLAVSRGSRACLTLQRVSSRRVRTPWMDGNVLYAVPKAGGADTSRHVRACISPRTVRSVGRSVGAIVHYGGRRIERVGQSKSDSKSSLSLHYFIERTWCMVAGYCMISPR